MVRRNVFCHGLLTGSRPANSFRIPNIPEDPAISLSLKPDALIDGKILLDN